MALLPAEQLPPWFDAVGQRDDRFLPVPLSLGIPQAPDAHLGLALIDPRLASVQAADNHAPGGASAKLSGPEPERSGGLAPFPSTPVGQLTSEVQDALLARCELGLARPSADVAKQHAVRARNMGLSILADACHAVATADPTGTARAVLPLMHVSDRLASMHRRLPLL